jgi:hypothetical protein
LIGMGILLGKFGPLLVIPAIWAVHKWFTKRVLVPRLKSRFATLPPGVPLATSTVLVLGILLASYLPGRITYSALCDANAAPRIIERVDVGGFFMDELQSYRAERHLYEQGFAFVEAPKSQDKRTYIRYTPGDGRRVREVAVNELLSRYGLREERSEKLWGVGMTRKIVYELKSNRVLAEAASVDYFGGPLFMFLGVYGLSQCPDVRDEDRGAKDFETYFNLEAVVLRDHEFTEKADWFGKTGLSAEMERYVVIFLRERLGQRRFDPGAVKAADLSYVGSFTEGDSQVHYWRIIDRDEYAYVVYKDKWATTGWGDRKPPAKATQ